PLIVRLWDVASGKRREQEFAGGDPLFSPDGRTLTTVENDNLGRRVIHFWEAATGEKVRLLTNHTSAYARYALSPDGVFLKSGSPALSPDGKTLAVGDDGIYLYSLSWDKPSSVQVGASRRLASTRGVVTALAFSPDGRMLASVGSSDQAIH